MSDSGFDLGLGDPAQAGVYFTTTDDLDTLDVAARDAGLLVRRIDLGGCADKATLMMRLGAALDFPSGSGRNWDALADRLRDLSWLPAVGYALLIDAAGDLRDAEESDFDSLLGILEEAAIDWAGRETPFWAFLSLPDNAFDVMDTGGPE
ncbi:MAG: barstar family protein [Luteimonas sp.]